MKRIPYALGLVGLAVAIALLAHAGLQTVAGALAVAGWPLLWLVPLHLVPLTIDAASWRILLAPADPHRNAPAPVLVAIASVREAVNRLLPVASVGGELAGIRLVAQRGVPAVQAAASVVTETVLAVGNFTLLAALGLVMLALRSRASGSIHTLVAAVLIACPIALAALWLIEEGRIASLLTRLAARFFSSTATPPPWVASIQVFETELAATARRRGRLVAAALLQFVSFASGATEVWVALRLLGRPVDPSAALIIESVTLFVRNVAFAVPAGLGAQEAGIVFIGAALGLDQDVALGLALAKRMREVLFGVPALIGWHLWESAAGLRGAGIRVPRTDR